MGQTFRCVFLSLRGFICTRSRRSLGIGLVALRGTRVKYSVKNCSSEMEFVDAAAAASRLPVVDLG